MSTFTAKLRSCRLRKEWRVDIKKVCQCIHRRQAHNTHNHTHTTHTDIPRHTGIQHTGRQTHKVCNLQQHTSTHMHTALLGVCQFCGVSGRTSLLSPFNQENFDISNHTQGKDWMRIKMETITTNKTMPPKQKQTQRKVLGKSVSAELCQAQVIIFCSRDTQLTLADSFLFCLFGLIFTSVLQEASKIWRSDFIASLNS